VSLATLLAAIKSIGYTLIIYLCRTLGLGGCFVAVVNRQLVSVQAKLSFTPTSTAAFKLQDGGCGDAAAILKNVAPSFLYASASSVDTEGL
jgi:hypothetical protein